ncbi:GGDEF domain-containing protein ['Paenibacillus yunnanensis' Narsing Rao et al. 2020]|uniref:GGDEF domain-containing protein n=1 Tax=Paenibacillus tengchongensis TaxID=2608684 RepID=UPI00124D0374|nr:GGDEF domain-containing protein [Paenibacillus tengchongensis]
MVMMAAQLVFVLAGGAVEVRTVLVASQGHLFIACNAVIIIAMISAEMWLRSSWQYHKQAVAGCGFAVSYLMYFVLEPFVDGAQMTLMMPIMIALVYFDQKLLNILGVFSLMFYTAVYFGLERPLLGKSLLEFLLVECVFIVFVLLAQAVIIRAREVRSHVEQLTKSEQELMVERAISDKLLKVDALTGLYNHKSFHEYLDSLLEQCESNGLRLQLALFDIDSFKQINDTYGHWVGDLVLKELAGKVGGMIAPNDFAARYGGEEFAVIFTDKSFHEALSTAEELRAGIARMEHPYAGGKQITVSIGICDYVAGDGKELLFRKTDRALYIAKHRGKNKVVAAADIPDSESLMSYA